MKRYDSYKDSGVEWIGEIPSGWTVSKIMFISSKVTDGSHYSPDTQDIGRLYVTVSNVTKENNIDFESCSKISEESFLDLERNGCRPKKGDVLITKDGTIGRGLVVGDFNDYVILSSIGLIRFSDKIVSKYGLYYLLSGLNIDQMYSHVRGSGITRLTINLIKNLLFVIPSYTEQQQIVSFLDTKTSLIDSLIEKTQRKIELLNERRLKLIEEVILNKNIERVRLEYVVDLIKRPINRDDNQTYNKIGMYSWGRGIFKYPSELGLELGDSTFNFIHEGDLLLSGQFSWEGSVSMVDKEFQNCISSHRFHILMGRKDKVLNEYLWSYFTSQEGHFLLTENSFGSSGRNQPLNIGRLLKEKIPIPELSFQLKIKELVEYTRRFEKYSKKRIELLKEYRQSLISEVVTGKRKVV